MSHKRLGTNPFHACQHFDHCDLDLYLRPLPPGELRCLLATLVKKRWVFCGFVLVFLARRTKSRRAYVVTQSLALASASASASASVLASTSKFIITPLLLEVHLLYLPHTCLGIRPFHACQNLNPCDLDLDLRVCV